MGAFLDKPVTTKSCESHIANGIRVHACSMQGWRVSMEDAHLIQISLEGNEGTGFYGVFDGHGGPSTSEACRERLLEYVLSQPEYRGKDTTIEEYQTILNKGFFELDEYLHQKQGDQSLDHSGSTAITAFMTDTHIIVANVGDSRCMLSRDHVCVPMSSDHKPYNKPEYDRINKAGGSVMSGRVNGDLAVSRAFGDFHYKGMTDIPANKQMVIAEPEIRVIERVKDKDSYLMFSCDGIWDAISDTQECIDILNELLRRYESVDDALSEFLDICLEKGSKDNMTVVLVLLNNAPKYDPQHSMHPLEQSTLIFDESQSLPVDRVCKKDIQEEIESKVTILQPSAESDPIESKETEYVESEC